jgi:hypothetical protein
MVQPHRDAADGSVVRYARKTLASADRLAWARGLSAMAAMAARLAHSELRVIDDAWHMSVFTDPARLVSLLVAA